METFLWYVASNLCLAGLLAVLAWIVGWTVRNPQLKHGLWALVLIKLLMPPVFPIPTNWFRGTPTPSRPHLAPSRTATVSVPDEDAEKAIPDWQASHPTPVRVPIPKELPAKESLTQSLNSSPRHGSQLPPMGWQKIILLIWFMGSLISAGWVTIRCVRFRRFIRHAEPAGSELQQDVERICCAMGLCRPPQVFLVDAVFPPLVWSVFSSPQVFLPRTLAEEFGPQHRATVLAHELAHLRRKDHLFRWIEVCALVLYWWCPIAWWASREMRHAEEDCCDSLVLSTFPQSRQDYGEALFKTIEFLTERPIRIPRIAAEALGGHSVKRRIEMIMTQPIPRGASSKIWAVCGVVGLLALPLAAENTPPQPSSVSSKNQGEKPQSTSKESSSPTGQETKTAEPVAPDNLPTELPEFDTEKVERVAVHLKPVSDVKLSSLHTGTVLEVHVSEGDQVKKGQVLVELMNTEIQIRYQEAVGDLKSQQDKAKAADLAVRQAKAASNDASLANQRAQDANLKVPGTISTIQLRQLANREKQARLALEQAELNAKSAAQILGSLKQQLVLATQLVEELKIKSPIDGIVLERNPKVGELATTNAPVARIVNLDMLTAEGYVGSPEGYFGKTVIIRARTSNTKVEEEDLPAKVIFVSPLADPITQRTKIRCLFKNIGADGQFLVRPGQSASLIVPLNP